MYQIFVLSFLLNNYEFRFWFCFSSFASISTFESNTYSNSCHIIGFSIFGWHTYTHTRHDTPAIESFIARKINLKVQPTPLSISFIFVSSMMKQYMVWYGTSIYIYRPFCEWSRWHLFYDKMTIIKMNETMHSVD